MHCSNLSVSGITNDKSCHSNMNQSPVGIARSKGYNAIVSMMTEKLQCELNVYLLRVAYLSVCLFALLSVFCV